MLKLQSLEPEWLGPIPSNDADDARPFLLPGVRVRFKPIGVKAVRAAREAVREALGLDAEDFIGAGDALSRELIRRGVCEWEGVGDRDGVAVNPTQDVMEETGEGPELRPGTISAFVDDVRAFEAADRAYVRPWAVRDMEGNASAGSPSGTGAEATPASDTALSPATPSSSDDAGPTPTPGPTVAPTSSTSPRPKKAKPSGRS